MPPAEALVSELQYPATVEQRSKQSRTPIGSDGDDAARWYVVRTKPRQEARVHANLKAWQVESYLPLIRKHLADSGEPARALFPNYLFARFSAERMLHKVMLARGVQYVIAFGGRPAEVDDSVIAALRAEEGAASSCSGMQPGDRIRVLCGPFDQFEGIFSEGCTARRVTILLDALNQATLVINRENVERVN